MKKILGYLNKAIEWIMFITLFALVAVCFAQVFTRFVLNGSIKWSDEVCRFMFVIFIFLGGIINARENRHTAIDLLVDMIPERYRNTYKAFLKLVSIGFCLVFSWAGVMWIQKARTQLAPILRFPMYYLYAFTVISGVLMAVNLFVNMIGDLKKNKKEGNDR